MPKPRGGRGKSVSYRTIQVRCPEPVKPMVDSIIESFHEHGIDNLNTGNLKSEDRYKIALEILAEYLQSRELKESKSTRDWTEFNKLKSWLKAKRYFSSGDWSKSDDL